MSKLRLHTNGISCFFFPGKFLSNFRTVLIGALKGFFYGKSFVWGELPLDAALHFQLKLLINARSRIWLQKFFTNSLVYQRAFFSCAKDHSSKCSTKSWGTRRSIQWHQINIVHPYWLLVILIVGRGSSSTFGSGLTFIEEVNFDLKSWFSFIIFLLCSSWTLTSSITFRTNTSVNLSIIFSTTVTGIYRQYMR